MQIIYYRINNPFSKDVPLSLEESDLAMGILKLAEQLEYELTRRFDDISPQGKPILDRCYAELRRTAKAYFGDKHGLDYDPKPGIPFPKKGSR